MKKVVILRLTMVIVSLVFSFFFINLYLKQKIPNINFYPNMEVLDNINFSSHYLYWEKSYCSKYPKLCKFEEEKYLPYPVEFFPTDNFQSCHINIKILFLGDSFTMAPWTNYGESFPSIFSNKLAKSLNICVVQYRLASPGSGTDQQLAVFQDIVTKLKPNIVIWQFFNNDIFDNIQQALFDVSDHKLIRRSIKNNFEYIAGTLNQKIPVLKYTSLGKYLMYTGISKDPFHNWTVPPNDLTKRKEYNSEKIPLELKEMLNLSKIYNFSFYSTLAPLECLENTQLICSSWISDNQNLLRQLLQSNSMFLSMEIYKSNNVLGLQSDFEPLPDNSELFNQTNDSNPIGSRHLNKQGNYVYGNLLFKNFNNMIKNK